jgi:hypothetical protein
MQETGEDRRMALSLKETRAVTGLVEVLYDFLPSSGNAAWRGHVNFGTVAEKVGLGNFWPGGSKKPAINTLLTGTLENRRNLFEPLILELVRCGIAYREKQGNPISAKEIDTLNGHIYEIGFKFPELWDKAFRDSLNQTTVERAQDYVKAANAEQHEASSQAKRSQELRELKEQFFLLCAESDRSKAGLALEKLLNRIFMIYELNPRPAFRVVGEQIDGSFLLEGEVYLVEAKWEADALSEAPLLVFRGKIEGKSTFTRGVFIALNDVTPDARQAITQGKSPSFFVMNGFDLMMVLSEAISLPEFLKRRIRLLGEEGLVCIAFPEMQARYSNSS